MCLFFGSVWIISYIVYILKDFKYATFLNIFQQTVDCKLPLLRLCHHELVSSANTLVLIVQINLKALLLRIHLGH